MNDPGSFYALSGVRSDGSLLSLSDLRGKVVYATNVASMWGETMPGYALFSRLAEKHGTNIAILAFPSKEYANEEFEKDEEIAAFARTMHFPFHNNIGHLMARGSVKGSRAPAIWRYLRDATGTVDPTWNFASAYLVSKSGTVHASRNVEADIAALLLLAE